VGGVVRAGERIMTIEIGVLYTGPMPGDPYDEYESFMGALPGDVVARIAFSRSDAVHNREVIVQTGDISRMEAALERGFPARNRAEVAIIARGGAFVAAVEDPRGDPANPLEPGELAAKFRRLTRGCWSPTRTDALWRPSRTSRRSTTSVNCPTSSSPTCLATP
jgi:hypothetical protein